MVCEFLELQRAEKALLETFEFILTLLLHWEMGLSFHISMSLTNSKSRVRGISRRTRGSGAGLEGHISEAEWFACVPVLVSRSYSGGAVIRICVGFGKDDMPNIGFPLVRVVLVSSLSSFYVLSSV